MSNIWGRNLRLSIFGESHGEGIGIVIDGLPAGFAPDISLIEAQMARRAPGGCLATPRKEADRVEILSGLFKGKTTGAPLCGIIRNRDTRSSDYNQNLPRPGTADLTAYIKYKGFNDYRGGGHFSGRITAPLTFAGSMARQILEAKGIYIGAHILQIGEKRDEAFDRVDGDLLKALNRMDLPLINSGIAGAMNDEIIKAKEEGDSVGGIIECASWGQPAGLGSPFFQSMESTIASMIFSIPGTKGIEFGKGFEMANMRGSRVNDEMYMDKGNISLKSNNSGGINGGITNGMPIVFRTVFRPTPSISKSQATVNMEKGENIRLEIAGRHDPCIVPRAVVVVESALALCLMEHLPEGGCTL
ncbi:chorismate synthase [Bacillota bacterium]